MTADGTLDLDAIKARAEAATAGPWEADDSDADGVNVGWYVWSDFDETTVAPHLDHDDAEFIAHAREDVPALIAEVERLRAGREIEQTMLRNAATRLAERDEARVGAKVLGETLHSLNQLIIAATDSHDLIDDTGDGDWDEVLNRLHDLKGARGALARVQALIASVDHIEHKIHAGLITPAQLLAALDRGGEVG